MNLPASVKNGTLTVCCDVQEQSKIQWKNKIENTIKKIYFGEARKIHISMSLYNEAWKAIFWKSWVKGNKESEQMEKMTEIKWGKGTHNKQLFPCPTIMVDQEG